LHASQYCCDVVHFKTLFPTNESTLTLARAISPIRTNHPSRLLSPTTQLALLGMLFAAALDALPAQVDCHNLSYQSDRELQPTGTIPLAKT
jgi:hypothetical protein